LSVEEPGRDQGRIESDGLALDVRVEPPLIIGLDQVRTEYSIDRCPKESDQNRKLALISI
jgi:hypothetical protein